MPALFVDTEQARLITIAVEMLGAALTARTERADPGKTITDAIGLQARKLATVLAELSMPEPPPFSQLDEPMRRAALQAIDTLVSTKPGKATDAAWEQLRRIAIAPGVAGNVQAGQ